MNPENLLTEMKGLFTKPQISIIEYTLMRYLARLNSFIDRKNIEKLEADFHLFAFVLAI